MSGVFIAEPPPGFNTLAHSLEVANPTWSSPDRNTVGDVSTPLLTTVHGEGYAFTGLNL